MADDLTTIVGRLRYARPLKDNWGKLEIEADGGLFGDASLRRTHTVMTDGVQNYLSLIGLAFEVTGIASNHPQYGEQIKARSVVVLKPRNRVELRSWLIGRAVLRHNAVVAFIESLETDEDVFTRALTRLATLNPDAYVSACNYIEIDFTSLAETKAALIKMEVPEYVADKAIVKWKAATLTVLDSDPYQLMALDGIGFKRADAIARGPYKLAADDPRRVRALCGHIMKEHESDGHTYLHLPAFLARLRTELPSAHAGAVIEEARNGKSLFIEVVPSPHGPDNVDVVQACGTFHDEQGLGDYVVGHCDKVARCNPVVPTFEGVQLSAEQHVAVAQATTGQSMILTGFPGTGKTTTIKAIVQALRANLRVVVLAAPTGKAARRIVDSTGVEALTVHRLLGDLAWWKHTYGDGIVIEDPREFSLDVDTLIVDESSMLDTALAERVLHAARGDCQIIFVGDDHQLASVGPGAVLRDLVQSRIWPHVHLTEVFRAAEGSWVVRNAPLLARGELPDLGTTHDFEFFQIEDVAEARRVACSRMAEALQSGAEAQLLAPQRNRECGVSTLNGWTKGFVNPCDDGWVIDDNVAVGRYDLVMQTTNDYERGIFNGETGQIRSITKNHLIVHFDDPGNADGRRVEIGRLAAKNLQLAYALTVHKSQGSEWDHVIFVAHPQHQFMLDRNLIYTAITRAKKRVTIIGTRQALRQGLAKVRRRETLLKDYIEQARKARTDAG